MAQGMTCDGCGKPLLVDEDIRYIARVELFAAYDPMELTEDDLAADNRAEIRRLVRKMHRGDADELGAQVYEEFRFDLCPACRKAYSRRLKDALPPTPDVTESED